MKSFKQFLNEDRWYDEPEYTAFGGENIRRLYGAITQAEHRANAPTNSWAYNPNLAIRTKEKSGKSSAYGPVQITRDTARGFYKQNPELFKGVEKYTQQFINQGTKMLKSPVKHKKYGAGGAGDLSGEQYHPEYMKMAGGVIRGKMKELKLNDTEELAPEQREKFIEYWRNSTREKDPEYFKAIDDFYAGKVKGQ